MNNILFNEIFARAKKQFLRDIEAQQKTNIAQLYELYCAELEQIGALNDENKNSILKAILRARMNITENEIYSLNNELEIIRKHIKLKENELFSTASECLNELKDALNSKEQIDFLDELMLHEASALKILYETSQNAFISVLETGTLVQERCFLISNYMLINVLEYARFDKSKIIDAAGLILQAAMDLAAEWQSYGKELLSGVINGLLEAIFVILEKLKKDLEASLNNEELDHIQQALLGLESEFVMLLKSHTSQNAAGLMLESILKSELDSNFAKLKRLVRENSQLLKIKLINFQNSELNAKIKKELKAYELACAEFDAKKLAAKVIAKFKK